MTTLAEWDGERAFSQQEQSRIELFLIRMTTLQNAPNSHDGIEKNLAEIFGQSPTEKYSLAGYFTASDFSKPINLPSQTSPTTLSSVLFRDNRLVFIVSHDHAMPLFKHDKKYYFCNPSAERPQEFDESQIDTLINQIFASNERYQADKPSPLGFFIFGFEENPTEYPTQEALLAQLTVQETGIDPTYMALNIKNTALHLAATMGCLPSFNFYLAQPENRGFGSLTREDNNGLIPIHNAAIKGHNNIVTSILASSDISIVNRQHRETGMTPLFFAAGGGHAETVTKLLAHGADINLQSNLGTALVAAALKGHRQTVSLLLENLLDDFFVEESDDINFRTLVETIYQIPPQDSSCFQLGISLLEELQKQKCILDRYSSTIAPELFRASYEVYKTGYQTACQLLRNPDQALLVKGLLEPLQKATNIFLEPTSDNINALKTTLPQVYGRKNILQQLFGALTCLMGAAMVIAGALGIPFTGGASLAGMYTIGSLCIVGGSSLFFNGRKESPFSQNLSSLVNYSAI